MFRRATRVFNGDDRWQTLPVPTGERYAWEADSTYVRKPPFLDDMPASRRRSRTSPERASCGLPTPSRPTTSRRPVNMAKSPAAKYLVEHGVQPNDFNSYVSSRQSSTSSSSVAYMPGA